MERDKIILHEIERLMPLMAKSQLYYYGLTHIKDID